MFLKYLFGNREGNMKQYGYLYSNFHEMEAFIHKININEKDKVLAQVFTGVIEKKFIENIIDELKLLLPQVEIMGATTSGEIYEGNVFSKTTVLCFSVYEKTEIKTKLFSNYTDDNELQDSIMEGMIRKDTKLLIVFSEGLMTTSEKVIKNLHSKKPDIVICGGKAADNGYLKETFVFTKDGIAERGMAVAALSGHDLKITTEYSFCWSTIGKVMTVTNAMGNRIFSINNTPVREIYRRYLGEDVAKELPMSATEFPLILKRENIDVARVPYECYDDGSMSFLGNINIGDKVQFGYGNVSMITEKSINILNGLKSKSIEGIFIYSCAVRRVFMQNSINIETLHLNKIAPTFGLFTYGEFFTTRNSAELMNVTMTVVGISEGEQNNKKDEISLARIENSMKNIFYGKELGVIKAFTNLTNQVTKELQDAYEFQEYQRKKMEQARNITNSIMEITNEMLHFGTIDSLLQIILDKVIELIPNAQMGSILFKEDNKLIYRAAKGYLYDNIYKQSVEISDILGKNPNGSCSSYEAKIIQNLGANLFTSKEGYNNWVKMFREPPSELLCCGIVIDDEILGLVNIFNTDKQKKFLEEDKPLIKHFCNEIAMTLKNAQLLEKILHMSRYDYLTNLYNRNYLREVLIKILNNAINTNNVFSICILDLNNLKTINDTYGHEAGDKFLLRFVEIFRKELSREDLFGRTGGDEFTIIFVNKNRKQAMNILDDICKVFKKHTFHHNGCNQEIRFAYGVSEFPAESENIEKLIIIADERMYEKKKEMKNLSHL